MWKKKSWLQKPYLFSMRKVDLAIFFHGWNKWKSQKFHCILSNFLTQIQEKTRYLAQIFLHHNENISPFPKFSKNQKNQRLSKIFPALMACAFNHARWFLQGSLKKTSSSISANGYVVLQTTAWKMYWLWRSFWSTFSHHWSMTVID